MTIELTDQYDVSVNGEDYSGRVYQLQINGGIDDPDSVTVVLHTGLQFQIPWEQYQRGIDNDE